MFLQSLQGSWIPLKVLRNITVISKVLNSWCLLQIHSIFLDVEYSDKLQKVDVTSQPALNNKLESGELTSIMDRITRSIADLQESSIFMLTASLHLIHDHSQGCCSSFYILPKSLDFSVIRDRLYPGMINFLSINKRRQLPQKIFENRAFCRPT